jgi:hypothetical protein
MDRKTRRTVLVFVALAMLVGSGCSKITRANWEAVPVGATKEEVIGIMGEAEFSPSGQEMKMGGKDVNVWLYRQKKQKVDIVFYFDPRTEELAAKEWDPWPNTTSRWDEHEMIGERPTGLNIHRETKSTE